MASSTPVSSVTAHLVRHTATAAARPHEVWAALAAFDRISTWSTGVDHSSSLSATIEGPGAVRRVQLGRSTLVETITTWEPERELAYEIGGLPPLVRTVVNRWRLEPSAGGTTVTLAVEVDPGPAPRGRVAARVLGLAVRRPTRRLLDDLVAHVAASRAVPADGAPT
jgi:uncharacterized protein YndB with AHSA1/START domain